MSKHLKSMNFVRIVSLSLCLVLAACSSDGEKSKISKNKRKAYLHLRLGTAFLKNEKYPQAIQEFRNSLSLDSENHVVHNNLALAYYGRGKEDLAVKSINRALKIKPNYTEAKLNYARILIETHRYMEAINILKNASKDLTYAHPEKTHASLGEAYYKLNEYTKAKEQLNYALQANRKYCPALRFHGQTLYYLKDIKNAAQSLDLAAANCPLKKVPEVLYYGGLSFFKLGELEKAEARLKELINLDVDTKYKMDAQKLLDSFAL